MGAATTPNKQKQKENMKKTAKYNEIPWILPRRSP